MPASLHAAAALTRMRRRHDDHGGRTPSTNILEEAGIREGKTQRHTSHVWMTEPHTGLEHFGSIVVVMCLANVYPNTGGCGPPRDGLYLSSQLMDSGQLITGMGKDFLKHFGFGA